MAHQSRLRLGRVSIPGQTYHIITSTDARHPLFGDLRTARTVILEMRRMHEEGWLHSHAWVLMPDHLHWLFTLRERASLSAAMNRFKSASAHSVRQHHGENRTIWQKGFFDHAARSDEDLRTIARYIIANPLRAGLCNAIGDYPWWDAEWL
ncbi:MAG: REP-associated tyrosine transposase [Sulfuricella sp.]